MSCSTDSRLTLGRVAVRVNACSLLSSIRFFLLPVRRDFSCAWIIPRYALMILVSLPTICRRFCLELLVILSHAMGILTLIVVPLEKPIANHLVYLKSDLLGQSEFTPLPIWRGCFELLFSYVLVYLKY